FLRRREDRDPGSGSQTTCAAAATGPAGTADGRVRAARNGFAVCRLGGAQREGGGAVCATPHQPGVRAVLGRSRSHSSAEAHSRDPGQPCGSQNSRRADLGQTAPQRGLPFHPHLCLLAEPGRDLVGNDHPRLHPAWRVSFGVGLSSQDHDLHPVLQPQRPAFPLDVPQPEKAYSCVTFFGNATLVGVHNGTWSLVRERRNRRELERDACDCGQGKLNASWEDSLSLADRRDIFGIEVRLRIAYTSRNASQMPNYAGSAIGTGPTGTSEW